MLVVKKFGGKILGTIPQIKSIANKIAADSKNGKKIVVIASAMGHHTDQLINLAKSITPDPNKREYNSLLACGEQSVSSLLTMALQTLNCNAKSYLGWQLKIRTRLSNNAIEIVSLDTEQIHNDLADGKIVVVAGFQGIDENNDITTLDRGGSDLTAVAVTKFICADRCEIYKDTGGIYTTDPNVQDTATLMPFVSYGDMIQMVESGSQVLHLGSIQLAKNNNIPLYIMNVDNHECGSVISNAPTTATQTIKCLNNDDYQYLPLVDQYESQVRLYSRHFPDVFSYAKGSYIYSKKGKTYLDFFMGSGALNYGHNNPVLKQPIVEYLINDGIIHSLDMYTSMHIKFLMAFQDIILKPRDLNYKIQFPGPTGTNAVEAALKLARIYTKRKDIIYFEGAYHGLSLGSLAVSDLPHKKANIPINFQDIIMLPYDDEQMRMIQLDAFKKNLLSLKPEQRPAAIILELIQVEGGINVASKVWLRELEKIANEFKILLIVDDIQVGCGRTNTFFSFEEYDIKPDIICMSKSLSGYGLPLSMILLKPELDVWQHGEHTGTFRSNNLALVSATKALDFWLDNSFIITLNENSILLHRLLQKMIREHDKYAPKIKGRGLIKGIEWSQNDIANRVSHEAFKQGLIVEPVGKMDQVLKITPALTVTKEEITQGINILASSIAACLKND